MRTDNSRATDWLSDVFPADDGDDRREHRAEPRRDTPPPRMPEASAITPKALERRWRIIEGSSECSEALLDAQTFQSMKRYQCNIENFIGTVKVPVGVAGPPNIPTILR